jgi:hypothetical protein
MASIVMRLVSRLDDLCLRTPVGRGEFDPALIGGGDDDLICPHCYFKVALAVSVENLGWREIMCPRCNCRMEIPV